MRFLKATQLKNRLRRNDAAFAVALSLRAKSRPVLHYGRHGHVFRRRAIGRYVASTNEPKLQIGAGTFPSPGWLNSDLVSGEIYLDISRRLPVRDSTFTYVFGEHVIEHVSDVDATRALREFHRILRPGGVLRLTTPDLEKLIAIYEDRNPHVSLAQYAAFLDDWTSRPHDRRCQVLNDTLRLWGHRYIYDEEDLRARLRAVGFAGVERVESGESVHEALRGLERHGPEWLNRAEAMCLEATKEGHGSDARTAGPRTSEPLSTAAQSRAGET